MLNSRFIIIIGVLLVFITFLDNTVGSFLLYSYEIRSSYSTLVFISLIFIVSIISQFLLIGSVMKTSRSIAQLK